MDGPAPTLMTILLFAGLTSAVYRLQYTPPTNLHLPSNILQIVDSVTYDGPATVAVASRTVYKCVSFASLISTYNSMDETLTPMPPSKAELEAWIRHNGAVIGPTVNGGTGEEFAPCNPGSELLTTRVVDSAEIVKSCYPSNLFRSACFLSWSAHFKIIQLPVFMDALNSSYIISPSGQKLPAVVGEYHSQDSHALLITAAPRSITKHVTLNCFLNHKEVACVDMDASSYARLTLPPQTTDPNQNFVLCKFSFCWHFPGSFFTHLSDVQDAVTVAHNQATEDRKIQRMRRKRNTPTASTEGEPEKPSRFVVNTLPTSPASYADVEAVEERLHSLYQIQLYNTLVQSRQISDLERIQFHTVLSVAKLDDKYLSQLWQQSFTTHFLNYDHFTIRPYPRHDVTDSNCRRQDSEIYLSGHFVPRQKPEVCHRWQPHDVTGLTLYQTDHLIFPSYSDVKHTAAQSEFSWSDLLSKRHGLDEGMLLRHYGGVRSTGLIDTLQYPPNLIPTYFASLFSLSGIGTLGFILILLFCCVYVRH